MQQFYECGICGTYHPAAWDGDCRQDNARFFPEMLDERFGEFGWEEVSMDAVPVAMDASRFLPDRPLGFPDR